jgi:hypothetical protein
MDPDDWYGPLLLAFIVGLVLIILGPSCSVSVSIDSRPSAVRDKESK